MSSNIRVYRYGLLPPTAHSEIVREQMRAAHRYRNTLTEIERARRAAVRAELPAEVHALGAAAREADERAREAASAVKAARAETRTRAAPPELLDALAAAREPRAAALQAFWQAYAAVRVDLAPWLAGDATGLADVDCYLVAVCAYKALDACTPRVGPNDRRRAAARDERLAAAAAIQDGGDVSHPVRRAARLDAINLRAAALSRAARAGCGLNHGTYTLVEAAMDAARKAPLFDKAEPNDPRYVQWDGECRVGVQLQGGLTPAEAIGSEDPRIQIAPATPLGSRRQREGGKGPSEKRLAMYRTLRMRVGLDRSTLAEWPMIMHRSLPDGAVIKQAVVSLRRHGPREEWSLHLTVDCPADTRVRDDGIVNVDVGWRIAGDEMVVARWSDIDGRAGELRLDKHTLDGLHKPEELRSIRDKHFNVALAALVAWLREHEMPDWMRALTVRRGEKAPSKAQALAYLSGWRSPARLAALGRRWRDARFDGDAEAYGRAPTPDEIKSKLPGPGLEGWRYHDHHLWAWEANQRTGAQRHRRDLYRCFAADLARRYRDVALLDVDYSEIARRPDVADEDGENEHARSNRVVACVSQLRDALAHAFGGERLGGAQKTGSARKRRKESKNEQVGGSKWERARRRAAERREGGGAREPGGITAE